MLQSASVQSCKLTEHLITGYPIRRPEPAQDKWYVRLPLHINLGCFLGWCLIARLRVSFISMSDKSRKKSEVTVLTKDVYWNVKATTKQKLEVITMRFGL